MSILVLAVPLLIIVGVVLFVMTLLRRVVPTNMMHIVQSKSSTISYGAGQKAGNVYYAWPAFLPVVGVDISKLPVSNFKVAINGYDAYDKDRVPFVIDVVGFFQISDTTKAAARVRSQEELQQQLQLILQGAIRAVLAAYDINQIMGERATFGDAFTKEVTENLAQWGVTPVKNVELMDIQDSAGSQVIHNLMQVKTAHIAAESRKAVAAAQQDATSFEIAAQQAVELRRLEAEQTVQKQDAETKRAIELAKQEAQQQVLVSTKLTITRQQEADRERAIQQAEIERAKQLVVAEQDKQVLVVKAQARLEQQRVTAQEIVVQAEAALAQQELVSKQLVVKAQAELQQQELNAKGVEALGTAQASAEKARLLAPVEAQLKLAQEIGTNEEYLKYLISVEALKTATTVGTAQAVALQQADVKIFSNTGGSPTDGISSVSQLVNPNGGLKLAGMVEALMSTPTGASIIDAVSKQNKVANQS